MADSQGYVPLLLQQAADGLKVLTHVPGFPVRKAVISRITEFGHPMNGTFTWGNTVHVVYADDENRSDWLLPEFLEAKQWEQGQAQA